MRWLLTGILAVLLAVACATSASAAPQRWVLVSDVHFTPFLGASSGQIAQLQAAPVRRWRSILARQGTTPSPPSSDSNAALLEASLRAMRRAAPHPPVVVLTGDLLAHDFQKAYTAAMPDAGPRDYEAFVDKTVAYLALRFGATYPRAQYVLTLGNNDSSCGDYEATPDSPFLLHAARAWAPLVNRHGRAPGFVASFRHLGSYTAKLPVRGLHAVSVDDVFWSADYDDACGAPGQDPALGQANWLTRATQALPRGHRAWLTTHIPPGIDVYATLSGSGAPVSLLSAGGQAAMLQALDTGRVSELVFGHLHMNTYRLGHGTPMLGVPSISPIFGNDPAFLVATVGRRGIIDDYTAYALDLARPGATFAREYDFGDTYGLPAFDLASLQRLGPLLAADARLRSAYEHAYVSGGQYAISERQYPAYACGTTALDAAAFAACLTP
jgi:sphingomyelin phosphodiesterase acid-like 3